MADTAVYLKLKLPNSNSNRYDSSSWLRGDIRALQWRSASLDDVDTAIRKRYELLQNFSSEDYYPRIEILEMSIGSCILPPEFRVVLK